MEEAMKRTKLLPALLVLGSCAHGQAGPQPTGPADPNSPDAIRTAAQSPYYGDLGALLATPEAPVDNPGSLWDERAYRSYLDYDQTAHAVGDLVTIQIIEETQASRTATTNLNRAAAVDAEVSAMLGLDTRLAEVAPQRLAIDGHWHCVEQHL